MTTIALPTAERTEEQYSLAKILSIWAVVSLPMPVLAFVIAPALFPHINLHPGIVIWLMMIVGMFWQFVVSLSIVYTELGTLRWSAIRKRTWLTMPRDPPDRKTEGKVVLVAAACFLVHRPHYTWHWEFSGVWGGKALPLSGRSAQSRPRAANGA